MTLQEATKESEKNKSIAWYLYPETINQILIDLYIGFQSNTDDAVDSRNSYKGEIVKILDSFKSTVRLTEDISGLTFDQIEWGVEDTVTRYVNHEVYMVVNYIVNHNSSKPSFVPKVFNERMTSMHISLSYDEFYRYR